MSGRGRVFYAGAAFESPRPALAGSMMMLTKRLMRVATAIAISSPTLRALPGGRSRPPKSKDRGDPLLQLSLESLSRCQHAQQTCGGEHAGADGQVVEEAPSE